mgnify:CR=1 FL=1
MAQNYDFLVFVKALDQFAREDGFPCAGRCFQDEAAMLFDDRRETINDFLLPSSELHERRIAKVAP